MNTSVHEDNSLGKDEKLRNGYVRKQRNSYLDSSSSSSNFSDERSSYSENYRQSPFSSTQNGRNRRSENYGPLSHGNMQNQRSSHSENFGQLPSDNAQTTRNSHSEKYRHSPSGNVQKQRSSENFGQSPSDNAQTGRNFHSDNYRQSPSGNVQKRRSSENFGQSPSDNAQTGRNSHSENYRQSPSGNVQKGRSPRPENYLPYSFASSRGDQYERSSSYREHEELKKIVDKYFNKRMRIVPPTEGWALPRPETMFTEPHWTISKFLSMKSELNDVKTKLDHYKLEKWHKHTRFMNKAGKVQYNLRNLIKPELLTQAWCKFYENAMAHQLIPSLVDEEKSLVSIHLCEAPGAFITSLNHYLRLNHPDIKWKWLATTLNPYYEGNPLSNMINDDRFILKTMNCWSFGADYTGDLMQLYNLDHLVHLTEKMGKVLLVTADGSIDCQEDPGEQESVVSSLHYCEAVTALHILATGGSFLIKMFTMYEEPTISLMYLLCNSFNSVTVNKPATSKEGNSEVYVVCLGFKGFHFIKPYLYMLRKHYGPDRPQTAMFRKEDIPVSFRKSLHNVAEFFMKLQIDVIERNIDTFENDISKSERYTLNRLREMVADEFIRRYELQEIDEKHEVVGRSKLKRTLTLNLDPRVEEGSFYERCQRKKLDIIERLHFHKTDVQAMTAKWPFKDNAIGWLTFSDYVDGFSIQVGKPVTTIHCSKFCLGRILGIRNEVQDAARQLSLDLSVLKDPENDEFFKWLENELNLKQYGNRELDVVDFNGKLWTLLQDDDKSNQQFEIHSFKIIMDFIDRVWRGQSLLMIDYPMLTQFNVGVIYFLCHMFERVGFVKPRGHCYAILFQKFRKWHPMMKKLYDTVVEMVDTLKEEGNKEAVLALFHISKLCEQYNDDQEENVNVDGSIEPNGMVNTEEEYTHYDGQRKFYQCITEINNMCVIEQVLDIIDYATKSNKKR